MEQKRPHFLPHHLREWCETGQRHFIHTRGCDTLPADFLGASLILPSSKFSPFFGLLQSRHPGHYRYSRYPQDIKDRPTNKWDFKHRFLRSLSGLRPVTPIPVLAGPRWGAAERRADAAVGPLAIDRPPSSRRVVLQDGWASAVSAGQEFWLRFCTHFTSYVMPNAFIAWPLSGSEKNTGSK